MSLMSVLLALMAVFTIVFFLTTFLVVEKSSAAITTRLSGSSSSRSSSMINSAYESLHSRMKLGRTLQTAREEPIRFMLVTGEQPSSCKTSQGSHLLMMSLKNKVDYCNLHQCKVWYSLEWWQPGFRGTWARYPLLKKLMVTNPSIHWFMWMDSDALFTDMSFELPLEVYDEWNKDMVVPGYWEKVYNDDPDWVGLNAGIFLIRNTPWSHGFLDKWMRFGLSELQNHHTALLNSELKTRPKQWPADDQSALIYLLRQNRSEHERRTYLEAGYSLHGFWELIVDKLDGMEEAGRSSSNGDGSLRWPFITHFCGCKLCTGEYASSQSKRCTDSFRRAYNFADNQLLAVVGMRHLDLSSLHVESF